MITTSPIQQGITSCVWRIFAEKWLNLVLHARSQGVARMGRITTLKVIIYSETMHARNQRIRANRKSASYTYPEKQTIKQSLIKI